MTVCVPIKDMKSTAKFTELVEREREVIVTRNGYGVMHCLSEDEYRLIKDEIAKSKLLSRIKLAEEQIAEGKYRPYSEFREEIRSKYDL